MINRRHHFWKILSSLSVLIGTTQSLSLAANSAVQNSPNAIVGSTTSSTNRSAVTESRASDTVFNTNTGSSTAAKNAPVILRERRHIRPLPGALNQTEVVNSNSPEVVPQEGILLSTYPADGMNNQQAHLNHAVQGHFEVFYHHIADGIKSGNLNDLHIGVLIGNRGEKPVKLEVLDCATYVSQPDAPFITLPSLVPNDQKNVYAGPGDRCTLDFLTRQSAVMKNQKTQWTIAPGEDVVVFDHAIPVRKLEPPLNGRNFMASLSASGPVNVAVLSSYNDTDRLSAFKSLLTSAKLVEPREKPASVPNQKGAMIYGRVAGVSAGSQWLGNLSDAGQSTLALPPEHEPVSFVISSLEGGTFSTGQVETAKLKVRYPDTAYSSHGNYGVRYLLPVVLENKFKKPATVSISLESPIKSDKSDGYADFLESPGPGVTFRGSVKVVDETSTRKDNSHYYHYVLRRGEESVPCTAFTLEPGNRKKATIELYYPADCTPPQLLTFKTSFPQ
ncbi:MAG: DUF3370 domain-containing protein [Cyanobacteria bacterium]|nr:DUF3370 domain-containing protein [Cyanobacteriota bacterium]